MICADGVPLTNGYPLPPVSVAAFDLDGAAGGASAGVGPSDLSVWMGDLFSSYRARSDYDFADAGCTSGITPADLSRWLRVFFAGGSSGNAAPIVCP